MIMSDGAELEPVSAPNDGSLWQSLSKFSMLLSVTTSDMKISFGFLAVEEESIDGYEIQTPENSIMKRELQLLTT